MMFAQAFPLYLLQGYDFVDLHDALAAKVLSLVGD